MSDKTVQFSNREWLADQGFSALVEISRLLDSNSNSGRDALIRSLEHRDVLGAYSEIIDALIQKAGLYPYLLEDAVLTTSDLVNYEYHTAEGLDGIHLHSAQARVYRALMDGVNVILSAPTSFGKSLLIDAVVASGRFDCLVVIVPTIALIDETRRRLSQRFRKIFKIITHPSQERSGKDIFILTQERYVEFEEGINPQFFVLDEFYKLSPNRGDERTFTLNQAFYKLFKSGAQFFLIGPNVQDIKVDEDDLNFRFFRFDFSTVATEIRYSGKGTQEENALDICKSIAEPTLIFCKSANSAYSLAEFLIENGVSEPTREASEIADWLRKNYHPEWVLARLLDHGFAVHHGSLPRSLAYHMLRKFNEGAIRFLFCTSTIIEGVNTSAKNIIIYDNKIATKKFDHFTFNNIKGRAGRMFQHFVGHVYVLHPEPDPELPIVDIPSITQSAEAPESLLIHLEQGDLSDSSIEQLRYLHAQDYLPMDVIRLNNGVDPGSQVNLASEIASNLQHYSRILAWRGFPNGDQLREVCRLIFDFLMGGKGRDGIVSMNQLYFQISRFASSRSIPDLLQAELGNSRNETPSQAIEGVLKFLRQWCEFHFPRYLSSLDRIQRTVLGKHGQDTGDYSPFIVSVKHLFMHPAVTVLEEYGLPYTVTQKILKSYELGEDVDSFIENLRRIDPGTLNLPSLESEMLTDALKNL
jgi:hypothetical protein